jgi:hypothetical protein
MADIETKAPPKAAETGAEKPATPAVASVRKVLGKLGLGDIAPILASQEPPSWLKLV